MYLTACSWMFGVSLLLVLFLPRTVRSEPVEPAPRRHIVLSELPKGSEVEIRIAADVPVVVRFESEIDPAETRIAEEGPSPFESLNVSGRLLLLHPSAGVWLWPRQHLRVRLVDGASLSFVLVPGPPAMADVQVDVFISQFSPGALRATLEKVRAENEVLNREYWQSQAELERYRADEFDPDVAIAVLLLDDEASSYLLKGKPLEVKSQDVRALLWFVRIAGRSAYVFLVTNRHRSKSWTLRQGMILHNETCQPLPVVVRARPSTIEPGGSGRVVLVTRTPSAADKDLYTVKLLGPDGPVWQLDYSTAKL